MATRGGGEHSTKLLPGQRVEAGQRRIFCGRPHPEGRPCWGFVIDAQIGMLCVTVLLDGKIEEGSLPGEEHWPDLIRVRCHGGCGRDHVFLSRRLRLDQGAA